MTWRPHLLSVKCQRNSAFQEVFDLSQCAPVTGCRQAQTSSSLRGGCMELPACGARTVGWDEIPAVFNHSSDNKKLHRTAITKVDLREAMIAGIASQPTVLIP